jgi:hypothetical protein
MPTPWSTYVYALIHACSPRYTPPGLTPHSLYGIHENSIPFPHRDLAASYLTLLSLLNRETTTENVVLYNLSSESYLNDTTDDQTYPAKPDNPNHDLPLIISSMLGRSRSRLSALSYSFFTTTSAPSCFTTTSSSSPSCACLRSMSAWLVFASVETQGTPSQSSHLSHSHSFWLSCAPTTGCGSSSSSTASVSCKLSGF